MKKTAREPSASPLATPREIEDQATAKNAAYARHLWPVLRGMVSIVALCASVPFLRGLLFEDKGIVATTGIVFGLTSFALIAMTPTPAALAEIEGKGPSKMRHLPPWPLVIYLAVVGLEFNWACVFFGFSRRYAFFSIPVISVTGLIIASYAAIALLVARLTGNWRIALAIFGSALIIPPAILLRLGVFWS